VPLGIVSFITPAALQSLTELHFRESVSYGEKMNVFIVCEAEWFNGHSVIYTWKYITS